LAAPEPDAQARDGSRLADLAAALPEAEPYTRDEAPSAEQSFAAQAPAGVPSALAPLDVQAALPDSEVQHWQLDWGLMEHLRLEEQPHAVLLLLVEQKVAIPLSWDSLAWPVLQEWLASAWVRPALTAPQQQVSRPAAREALSLELAEAGLDASEQAVAPELSLVASR